jgi:hypothetical protein
MGSAMCPGAAGVYIEAVEMFAVSDQHDWPLDAEAQWNALKATGCRLKRDYRGDDVDV